MTRATATIVWAISLSRLEADLAKLKRWQILRRMLLEEQIRVVKSLCYAGQLVEEAQRVAADAMAEAKQAAAPQDAAK